MFLTVDYLVFQLRGLETLVHSLLYKGVIKEVSMLNLINKVRWVKIFFYLFLGLNLSNCSQFVSFSGSEEDVHFSGNPVFSNPDPAASFIGADPARIWEPRCALSFLPHG